jgi:hypothetical protein
MVGFESVVMNDGVRPEGVIKTAERPVHEITVQRPFKERTEDNPAGKAGRRPKYKRFHIHDNEQMRVVF